MLPLSDHFSHQGLTITTICSCHFSVYEYMCMLHCSMGVYSPDWSGLCLIDAVLIKQLHTDSKYYQSYDGSSPGLSKSCLLGVFC